MQDIGLEIKKLNNSFQRYFANLKSTALLSELTGSNGYILIYLMNHRLEVITQKNIEETLGITRSTASIVLSNMERVELITRQILSSDSRRKSIHITDKGIELYNRMTYDKNVFEKKIRKGFSQEELELFLSMLTRIKNNLEEEKA